MGLQIRINLIWTLTEKRLIESLILMKLFLSYNTGKNPYFLQMIKNITTIIQYIFAYQLKLNGSEFAKQSQSWVSV